MSALGLAAIVGGLVLLRAAFTGSTPVDVVRETFTRADLPTIPPSGPVLSPITGAPISGTASERVEQWRPLVQQHFPTNSVEEALRVMECESSGNPTARNPLSGAAGLFQHLPIFWPQRAKAAGVEGANPFDPEANVIVTAWLYSKTNDWRHWACKP